MDNYSIRVLQKIIVLFIAMIAGFIIKKAKICDKSSTKSLSGILASITNPCLIISSLQTDCTSQKLYMALKILALSLVIHAAMAVLSPLIFKPIKNKKESAVYSFAMTYGNCGFMGYPIMMAIFGSQDGLYYGVIYTVMFNIFCWSHGVFLMSGDFEKKTFIKKLLNPVLISVFVGFFLFATNIRLPEVINEGITMLGDMTIPLSMLIIGSLLADINFSAIFKNPMLYIFSFIKLFIIPFAVMAICIFIGLDKTLAIIAVTMAATPAATNTAVLAEVYGGDSNLAAKLVGVSTLFCLISMPIVLKLSEFFIR